MINGSRCRLCEHATAGAGIDALGRELFKCANCGYVYVSKKHFLKPEEEKGRYMYHKNSIKDLDYVAFLRRLIDPLMTFLKHNYIVLDYGSGPEPVLAELLEQKKIHTFTYDPFFSPLIPGETFDAVTITEALEHFHNPKEELETIISLIDTHGYLGIITERYSDKTNLKTWYYARDPTHVGFFSDRTFSWFEKKYSLERVYDDGERVLIFRKS